jgi:type I restriction enzyme, R subunit
MPTNTNERGLETLIQNSLINEGGYERGFSRDYDREHCVDVAKLKAFLLGTQPEKLERLTLSTGEDFLWTKILSRLKQQIDVHGVLEVIRHGLKIQSERLQLYFAQPVSNLNPEVIRLYEKNIFSVTTQLHFTSSASLALDMVVFINGLPVATFELKNNLSKQNVADAMWQYKTTRSSKEPLFYLGRCLVHFALDDQLVFMTSHLQDKNTNFLPFNKGFNYGAGNPPNPNGIKTDYLWREVLGKPVFSSILEKFAQFIEKDKSKNVGRKRWEMIFPRYHQLNVVQFLIQDLQAHSAGRRYLIQHSAGSGKSASIAWLAYQLTELTTLASENAEPMPMFDSVIVVTDRINLDTQIRDTIKSFDHENSVLAPIDKGSKQLRLALESGKKLIITTVQKFPFIVDEIQALPGAKFAIIIDEAHSSQSGDTARKMNEALAKGNFEPLEGEDNEDFINRLVDARKMLKNASYFAFTATPKNKTLQVFGRKNDLGKFVPHHEYSMKQAIEEKFIFDVLQQYTSYQSYYRLVSRVESESELFDTKLAQKRLRRYVESHPETIEQKARIMLEHFRSQVANKIGKRAKAMIVTKSIVDAVRYKQVLDRLLGGSGMKALVAFTGEKELEDGSKVTEDSMNGFKGSEIPETFKNLEYRFLIVAEKFQTGFDEPLLHTMYVDKTLSGITAVQTLSRLNRACVGKEDTFVLDFANDPETIRLSFEPYYKGSILENEADVDRLNDLELLLERSGVYRNADIRIFTDLYYGNAAREQLDPILDASSAQYQSLDSAEQIEFKGNAKAFVRTYEFLSSILPFTNTDWERLNTFLKYLITKLPTPTEEDHIQGLLERIQLDEISVVKKGTQHIHLEGDTEVLSLPLEAGTGMREAELEPLEKIIKRFNERFALSEQQQQTIAENFARARQDKDYISAKQNSGYQNARIAFSNVFARAMQDSVFAETELYKRFVGDQTFREVLEDTLLKFDYATPAPTVTEKPFRSRGGFGSLKGWEMAKDFDEPLEDFKEYTE